jgi:hypothetical protein
MEKKTSVFWWVPTNPEAHGPEAVTGTSAAECPVVVQVI